MSIQLSEVISVLDSTPTILRPSTAYVLCNKYVKFVCLSLIWCKDFSPLLTLLYFAQSLNHEAVSSSAIC